MPREEDTYAMLDTRDWTRVSHVTPTGSGKPVLCHVTSPASEYGLKSLDNDWHTVLMQHLSVDEHDFPAPSKTRSVDDIDARGTFNKDEAWRELSRLNRGELEGRLGLSSHKVQEVLNRAEKRSKRKYADLQPGVIHYKVFLEVIKEYRLSSEQASTLKSVSRVFAHVEEFTCVPPTLVMVSLTLAELALYLVTVFTSEEPVTWTGPVPFCSPLIYNPYRRHEIWRYATYMFVHIGIGHFVFNMIMQIIVGISLEMEQSGWLGSLKVFTVYMAGVLAGSLGTSLSDSSTYLAGASGGVYALIAAHLATMTLNWQEDSSLRIKKVVKRPITKIIRIAFILLLSVHDVVFAIWVRFNDPENRTGFMGHLCGALAGLTVGLFVLDNRKVRSWEPIVQWAALIFFLLALIFAVVWNVMANSWVPDFYPELDTSSGYTERCRELYFRG